MQHVNATIEEKEIGDTEAENISWLDSNIPASQQNPTKIVKGVYRSIENLKLSAANRHPRAHSLSHLPKT